MTATKGIQFEGRFFWAYDVSVGVFLKYLVDEVEAGGGASEPWLSDAVSHWRVEAAITEFGLTLEENWSTAQKQAFINFAEGACKRLATRESIPAEEIASWQLVDDLHIFPRSKERESPQRQSSNWAVQLLRWCLETCRDHPMARLGSTEHPRAARRSKWIAAPTKKNANLSRKQARESSLKDSSP
jgi:hypothetical protein